MFDGGWPNGYTRAYDLASAVRCGTKAPHYQSVTDKPSPRFRDSQMNHWLSCSVRSCVIDILVRIY